VCRISTTDGISGIGESRGSDLGTLCEIVTDAIMPLLVGECVVDIEETWQRLRQAILGPDVLRPAKWTRRAVLGAIGMVDQALWDIYAKSRNMPMAVAIGGERRAVPAYLSDVFYEPEIPFEQLLDEAEANMERGGYNALKVRIGCGVADSVDRVSGVRERFGDSVALMVDANQAWELTTAVRAAQSLDGLGLSWLEEPIKPHGGAYRPHDGHDANGDTGALADSSSIPIAIGENHVTCGECVDAVQRGHVGYMQFDAIKNGGVTEFLRVAEVCRRHSVPLAPHHVPHFHVSLASGVAGAEWVETFDNPLQHPAWPDLFDGFPEVINGTMTPPDAPGWGMDVNEDFLTRYGNLVNWRVR
jgi:L-talarate/galactarate dehydratase